MYKEILFFVFFFVNMDVVTYKHFNDKCLFILTPKGWKISMNQ